jgi:hypothetical protein
MSLASCSRTAVRRRRSIVVVASLIAASSLLVFALPTQAEGWKFWEGKETRVDDGLGGTPYASSARQGVATRSSGYTAPKPSESSSGGWNIGAGMSSAAKSVVNGASSAASKTASVTKKAAKKTVDIVTLKPLWGSKPKPNQFSLGSHPDPRKKNDDRPALWGTSSKTTVRPNTPAGFFSQPRVK